jgi:uncharacterized protein
MRRKAEKYLTEWKQRIDRKPLVVRGARQVGKTFLIEQWGNDNFTSVISLNLEQSPHHALPFRSLTPTKIIKELELIIDADIVPGKTLLFLDEIQSSPQVLQALRYFYEQLPELHVVAAGSLLDFTMHEYEFSVPVGRIEYLYLHPLSFIEYLDGTGSSRLAEFLKTLSPDQQIEPSVHEKLLHTLREYLFVGGMPAVVDGFSKDRDLRSVMRTQSSIILTMQEDFAKYRSRISTDIIRLAFTAAASHPVQRRKLSEISSEYRAEQLKKAFSLLAFARIVAPVTYSAAQGLPLSSHEKPDFFKPLFLDVGLCNRVADLPLVGSIDFLLTVREGELAEQFVGQQLLTSQLPYFPPQLHYWERLKKGASAEVDFLIAHQGEIIPLEVKAGRGSTLRSLHSLMDERNLLRAVRLSIREPSIEDIKTKQSRFRLMSYPLYCAEILPQLLRSE